MLILQQLHRHIPWRMRLPDNRVDMPFAVILDRRFRSEAAMPGFTKRCLSNVTLNRADRIDNVDTLDEMEQDVAQALGMGTR
jgi:hypothetical protein